MIPILDLKRQYKTIEDKVKDMLQEIVESQSFVLGKEVEKIEENISRYCGTKFAVGVASGTDALILSLAAMGIGKGDEVITTPFTFTATAEAIVHAGAKPVFVDIDPKTYNINPALIEKKITKRTKAILPVHLYGLCADMDPILKIREKHGLKVLEDCAQAIGSKYKGRATGSMGDGGAISFYPGKNLGCFGDGGMVVTNDKKIYDNMRLLRNHGSDKRYYHKAIGYNSRLDNLQAAILNIKLSHLDGWIENRIKIAEFFTKELKNFPIQTPYTPPDYKHSFHLYVLRTSPAVEIINYLAAKGIESRTYYPVSLHLQECFNFLGYKRGDFPESEKLSQGSFAIPIYPELTLKEKTYIVDTIKQFLNKTFTTLKIKNENHFFIR
ncbi:MAG: DegT/DnrJ/EryC1/StrS family aminotransferase [Candidatus Omnitrophota bacterium]|nr:MAG: DegT/DnrJ/EryC1/StrS family aminotransferase [Candidatus Omnitrophota bacterium]